MHFSKELFAGSWMGESDMISITGVSYMLVYLENHHLVPTLMIPLCSTTLTGKDFLFEHSALLGI